MDMTVEMVVVRALATKHGNLSWAYAVEVDN